MIHVNCDSGEEKVTAANFKAVTVTAENVTVENLTAVNVTAAK